MRPRLNGRVIGLVGVVILTLGVFSIPQRPASARLASVETLPDAGEMCAWETSAYAASQENVNTADVTRPPGRYIRDTDPVYSSVTVDTRLNEVLLQDHNLWSIRVFNRQDDTPPSAVRTEPKRVIAGSNTQLQFNSCVYVDPKNGEIFSVENDIGDSMVVFSHDSNGNVAPTRKLSVTHRAYAIAADEEKDQLYIAVQYPPQIEVYRKLASGNEKPLRRIEGESTRLSDSHGIAVDTKNKLVFVNNWGNISDYTTAGTGRFEAPSITIYGLDASGDAPPLRVIQGPKTQLDWPAAMAVDPERGEVYVANDVGQSILVFRATDNGDTEPSRVLKGPQTGLSYPVGIFADTKNKELWVSNLGNSSATVYPLAANGNAAPLRTIRSAPRDKVSLRFGKTQALVYDSKRDEILVPN
jgi:6-phosphogluconolactonase (cycloisomerase 2 family)